MQHTGKLTHAARRQPIKVRKLKTDDFKPLTSLYICYQSVLEPLTQTQVVAYLQGLATAGHKILLLTYEPKPLTADQQDEVKRNLADNGILEWHWLKYHKRPSLLATLWDVFAGIWLSLRLVKKHRVTLIHARAHVPGLIGLWVKKLAGTKLLFDLRGLMAEEYADGGVWPKDGFLFRLTKRVERSLLKNSDAVVVLTENLAKQLLAQQENRDSHLKEPVAVSLHVIPCCVDCDSFAEEKAGLAPNLQGAAKWDRHLVDSEPVPCLQTNKMGQAPDGASPICSCPYMLYVGKMGGWYPTERMVDFFAAARDVIPNLRWKILTQHVDKELLPLLTRRELESHVEIGSVAPQDLPTAIRGALFALCFYDRKLSAAACSPTKIGEYLAAGVPVIANAGVGDVEQLLTGTNESERVGVVTRDTRLESYRSAMREMIALLETPDIANRCQMQARRNLDLETVGWPRYQRVYEILSR